MRAFEARRRRARTSAAARTRRAPQAGRSCPRRRARRGRRASIAFDDQRRRPRDLGRRGERRVERARACDSMSMRASATSSSRSMSTRSRDRRASVDGRFAHRASRSAIRSAPRAGSSPPFTIAMPGNVADQARFEQERQQAVLTQQSAGERDLRRRSVRSTRAQRRLDQIAELLRRLLHDLRRRAVAFAGERDDARRERRDRRRLERRVVQRVEERVAIRRIERARHQIGRLVARSRGRRARARTASPPASRSRTPNLRRRRDSRARRPAASARRARHTRSNRSRDQHRAVAVAESRRGARSPRRPPTTTRAPGNALLDQLAASAVGDAARGRRPASARRTIGAAATRRRSASRTGPDDHVGRVVDAERRRVRARRARLAHEHAVLRRRRTVAVPPASTPTQITTARSVRRGRRDRASGCQARAGAAREQRGEVVRRDRAEHARPGAPVTPAVRPRGSRSVA